MRSTFVISILITFSAAVAMDAKSQSLSGRVYDATNHTPLPYTAVVNLGDSTGTATDDQGYFHLQIRHPLTLRISHIGYVPQTVQVSEGTSFLQIEMQATETNLHEVMVRASQTDIPLLEAPVAVSIITGKQLERNDQTTISPALNLISGIYMHSGNLNTNRITIRGIGARTLYGTNKVKAYFNDIPLTTGEGETSLEDIDLSGIQRIEVIKGPASGIYGAGLGGAIRITSQAPAVDQHDISFKSLAGSYGLRRNVLHYGLGGNSSGAHFVFSDTHTNGYRDNSEYNRQSFIGTAQVYPTNRSMLAILGTFTHLKAYIPSSVDLSTFQNNPQAAAPTWLDSKGYEAYDKGSLGLTYHDDLTKNIRNVSSIFINFRNADEPRPFDILHENTVGTGFRTRVTASTSAFNSDLVFSTGFEYFTDWHDWSTYENLYRQSPGQGSVTGNILSDNEEKRYYYNVFGQIDVQLSSRLSLQAGINANRTHYTLTDLYQADSIDQSGRYTFETVWSPRVAVSYKLKDNAAVYATVNHGFSPPSLAETLTPEGTVNTAIQPEKGWSYEIGARSSWLQERLEIEVNLYSMRISDLLVAQRTGPDTYVGVNAGRTIHNGLEVTVTGKVVATAQWLVKPYLSAALMAYTFDKFIHNDNDYSGNDLTGVPSKTLSGGIDITSHTGFYLYSDCRYTGAIPLDDANTVYSDSYLLLNAKVGYQRNIHERIGIDLSMGVNNITDKAYASMVLVNATGFGGTAPRYYYPGLPRNYYGSAMIRYLIK